MYSQKHPTGAIQVVNKYINKNFYLLSHRLINALIFVEYDHTTFHFHFHVILLYSFERRTEKQDPWCESSTSALTSSPGGVLR